MDRAYLKLVRPDGKKLSEEERSKTAITAKVKRGSTLLTVDFSTALSKLATDLVAKMSPEQIVITTLGLGMVAGATVVAKAYVKSRAEKAGKANELEAQVRLSQQETERLAIVTKAMNGRPVLQQALEDFDDARDAVLRSAADARSVRLDGVTLTGEQARRLPREPRSASKEVQLNGVYRIRAVSWPTGKEEVVLDLRAVEKTLEFKASLSTESLLEKDKNLLAQAEWGRTPIYLSINARELKGEITKAVIVGFDWDALRAEEMPPV